jgi:hypothetical protein
LTTIDLEYTRDGNSFDLPQSRWLMTKSTVFDGHVGEGADNQVTTFRYSGVLSACPASGLN